MPRFPFAGLQRSLPLRVGRLFTEALSLPDRTLVTALSVEEVWNIALISVFELAVAVATFPAQKSSNEVMKASASRGVEDGTTLYVI
jgi:hypothetical protein